MALLRTISLRLGGHSERDALRLVTGANRPYPGDTPCPETWKMGDIKACWH